MLIILKKKAKLIDLQFTFTCISVALEKNTANIIFTSSPQTPY